MLLSHSSWKSDPLYENFRKGLFININKTCLISISCWYLFWRGPEMTHRDAFGFYLWTAKPMTSEVWGFFTLTAVFAVVSHNMWKSSISGHIFFSHSALSYEYQVCSSSCRVVPLFVLIRLKCRDCSKKMLLSHSSWTNEWTNTV
jgi:hypothetical protein